MKMILNLFIVLFVFSLSTPTLESLVEKDINIAYSIDDSEADDFQKEFKLDYIVNDFRYSVINPIIISKKIISNCFISFDKIVREIIILPPELI
ncbi:hypothetical protein [Flavobacterium sp.]|jgi:hypothetical protein|uniref:hypothetical protein n=1 Tax=Flavobacterium sp. TaxID=239 RepID=UPI0037BF2813